MTKTILAAILAMACTGGAAQAATSNIDLTPSNQNGRTIFATADNGNILGLFSITGAEVGDMIDLGFVQGEQKSGFGILNVFAGDPGSLPPMGYREGMLSEPLLTNINGGVTIESLSRSSGSVFDSLFIEFDTQIAGGVIAVFEDTNTFALNQNSLELQLESPAPVPVPAALPALLTAMGGFGLIARRRRAKA